MHGTREPEAGVNGYPVIDGCDTLPKLFLKRCETDGSRIAHREKRRGLWLASSWSDYLAGAREIGLGLVELGLRRGDTAAILADGCKAWLYADLGVQCVGGRATGIYPTSSEAQIASVLQDSESRFLIVEDEELLERFLAVRHRTPGIRRCILIRPATPEGPAADACISLDELRRIGRQAHDRAPERFRQEVARSQPDDIAILVYTSGTTGAPKGAMIRQGNLLACLRGLQPVAATREGDDQLCFLPLSHILERMVSGCLPIHARSTVNFAESMETAFENLREVSPHFLAAVPRVWEKIHATVELRAKEASAVGRWAYAQAIAAGAARDRHAAEGRRAPLATRIRLCVWDFLVLANLRRMTGLDRVRAAASGAAPAAAETLAWFRALGVRLVQGYGLTETTGIVSCNPVEGNRPESVGPAAEGVEIRIGAEGEILVRGPVVFAGYWKRENETRETLRDGWLRTGDTGAVDADGFLRITGRIKDILITAGGKNVAPAAWENRLKSSPYVFDAMMIGDRRSHLTALVFLDREMVEQYAQERRIPGSDFASLCRAEPVLDLVRAEIRRANAGFSRAEQVRDFRVVDRVPGPESEEVTPTLKLRRAFVERTCRSLVEEMYSPRKEQIP